MERLYRGKCAAALLGFFEFDQYVRAQTASFTTCVDPLDENGWYRIIFFIILNYIILYYWFRAREGGKERLTVLHFCVHSCAHRQEYLHFGQDGTRQDRFEL
jgi:hypothetical protein